MTKYLVTLSTRDLIDYTVIAETLAEAQQKVKDFFQEDIVEPKLISIVELDNDAKTK